jgi:hypothetical protein
MESVSVMHTVINARALAMAASCWIRCINCAFGVLPPAGLEGGGDDKGASEAKSMGPAEGDAESPSFEEPNQPIVYILYEEVVELMVIDVVVVLNFCLERHLKSRVHDFWRCCP